MGYIAPKDKLEGREKRIFSNRDRKLEEARKKRKARRLARENSLLTGTKQNEILQTAGETQVGSAGEQPARDNRLGVDG